MVTSDAMTIGQLARRTGVSIKLLREYEGLGFLYTLGRSAGNYRLFSEDAVWCVRMVQGLRSLGLTLREIHELVRRYAASPEQSVDALLDARLAQARARVEARMTELRALRQHILDFQTARANPGALDAPSDLARLLVSDPRRISGDIPAAHLS